MNYPLLAKSPLFRGVTEKELADMLTCLQTYTKKFKKNELIYRYGDHIQTIGLVLSGSVHIENDDFWGNKNILNHIESGQVFAEAYACIPGEMLQINVAAAENCEILFLNVEKVLKTCPSACHFHSRLIQNLLTVTASKNLALTNKIFHTTPKSIRGRLLSYLSWQAQKQGSSHFTIPFNRTQLAGYLGVDRSAMSTELGKMQMEGLLTYERNTFHLTLN